MADDFSGDPEHDPFGPISPATLDVFAGVLMRNAGQDGDRNWDGITRAARELLQLSPDYRQGFSDGLAYALSNPRPDQPER